MDLFCPFCNHHNVSYGFKTIDIYRQKWDIYLCNNCKFYFLYPFPDEKTLEKAYSVSYYGEGKKKFSFPLVENVLDYFRSQRARNVAKYLPDRNAYILDIGCGNGRFLNYLYHFGYTHLYGTELSGKSLQRSQQYNYLKIFEGSIETINFENNFFDAICIFHVLEHTQNPIFTLNKIKKILKPEGYLFISFPNISSKQAQKFKGYWLHLDPPRHLNFISPDDFISFMSNIGFSLVKEKYFSPEQNPFGYIQSNLNKKGLPRDLLFEAFKGNKNYVKQVSTFSLLLQYIYFTITMPYYIFIDAIESKKRISGTVSFIFKKTII